jgi:hypothetical protein
MASAWGSAWGVSWGVSWGYSSAPPTTRTAWDDGGTRRRRKFRREDIIAIVEAVQAAERETAPKPTAKKRKALARKIIETVGEDTFFAPAMKPVETFVRQEVQQFYQPGVSWAEVYTAVTRLIEAAQAEARRIEAEIEEEDEMVLLLVA